MENIDKIITAIHEIKMHLRDTSKCVILMDEELHGWFSNEIRKSLPTVSDMQRADYTHFMGLGLFTYPSGYFFPMLCRLLLETRLQPTERAGEYQTTFHYNNGKFDEVIGIMKSKETGFITVERYTRQNIFSPRGEKKLKDYSIKYNADTENHIIKLLNIEGKI